MGQHHDYGKKKKQGYTVFIIHGHHFMRMQI